MSRAKFEERFESVLTDLQAQATARNVAPGSVSSFCVSYRHTLVDFANAATKIYIPTMPGYRSELKSILAYNVTEVMSSAETVDFGPEDDQNEYLDAATLPLIAVAASNRVDLNTNAGAAPTGDKAIMDVETDAAGFALTFTSTPTTGIADFLITVRYYL